MNRLSFFEFAEGEGFKPPIPERGIPDFESSAIDHSANLPCARLRFCGCKGNTLFPNGQNFWVLFFGVPVETLVWGAVYCRASTSRAR